jgi:hypothetical protein
VPPNFITIVSGIPSDCARPRRAAKGRRNGCTRRFWAGIAGGWIIAHGQVVGSGRDTDLAKTTLEEAERRRSGLRR